jgi:glycosyltransferase involved in cell wall biosynthesis
MPKISIIVPVYNTEKYLRPCLDSIKAQTFSDFEAVLVDDGSTDQSGAICDEYAEHDPRFIVIHKQNEGVAKARITAFEQSKGDLITFIDSDDYVSPEYLERLSRPITDNDADMVSCNYYDVDAGDKSVKETKNTLQGFFSDEKLEEFIANHYFYDSSCRGFGMTNFLCTKMVKRGYVKMGLHDGVGMWFGEDQIAMFSMLYKIRCLYIIPERLYYYVHYKAQATQRYDDSLWESLIRMFDSYKRLDTKNIAHAGLHTRTWLYIRKTIQQKMIPTKISMNDFVSHVAKFLHYPYMIEFFKARTTGFGWRDDVKYRLLKLGCLRIFYFLFIYRQIRKR